MWGGRASDGIWQQCKNSPERNDAEPTRKESCRSRWKRRAVYFRVLEGLTDCPSLVAFPDVPVPAGAGFALSQVCSLLSNPFLSLQLPLLGGTSLFPPCSLSCPWTQLSFFFFFQLSSYCSEYWCFFVIKKALKTPLFLLNILSTRRSKGCAPVHLSLLGNALGGGGKGADLRFFYYSKNYVIL